MRHPPFVVSVNCSFSVSVISLCEHYLMYVAIFLDQRQSPAYIESNRMSFATLVQIYLNWHFSLAFILLDEILS